MDGFLNMLKPPGMTSSDLVLLVRKKLPRGVRVGHGGTLDPDAAGVLPVCVGSATRLFDYIIDKRKHYIAEMTLGVETDTQDASGEIVARSEVSVAESDILRALPAFTGRISQKPPAFSALKKDGKRLYEMARAGEAIETEARDVDVFDLTLLRAIDPTRYLLGIECGKGTYIRTLCHDIGRALGCGAHMSFLLRDRAGAFDLHDAIVPEALDDVEARLLPPDYPLSRYPALYLDETDRHAVENGNPVRSGETFDGPVRVYLPGAFAGMAERSDANLYRFKAMLLKKDARET